jgi:hypothetical protein
MFQPMLEKMIFSDSADDIFQGGEAETQLGGNSEMAEAWLEFPAWGQVREKALLPAAAET